jgi:predicted class III extradiol MEMO1 family dioxygenase
MCERSTATQKLKDTGRFSTMTISQDESEHSIEMHLPYIRKVFAECVASILLFFLSVTLGDCILTLPFRRQQIQIVPILVGSISTTKEAEFGQLLAPCQFGSCYDPSHSCLRGFQLS